MITINADSDGCDDVYLWRFQQYRNHRLIEILNYDR